MAKTQRTLALLVFGAVVSGMAGAVLLFNFGATGLVDTVSGLVSRWFFTVFCTVFAVAQARVYVARRRHETRLARHVPASPFALFTALWVVLAVAGLIYGIVEPGRYWEVGGWITITVVICVQLFMLGGLERRLRTGSDEADS